jgi:hypothetical protein
MVILTSSSSTSMVEVVGDEAADEADRTEGDGAILRGFIMPLRSCLYTRRAVFLLWLSRPSQEQNCGRNCCASLTAGSTRFNRTQWQGSSVRGIIALLAVASRAGGADESQQRRIGRRLDARAKEGRGLLSHSASHGGTAEGGSRCSRR